jgi:hypothetical protein
MAALIVYSLTDGITRDDVTSRRVRWVMLSWRRMIFTRHEFEQYSRLNNRTRLTDEHLKGCMRTAATEIKHDSKITQAKPVSYLSNDWIVKENYAVHNRLCERVCNNRRTLVPFSSNGHQPKIIRIQYRNLNIIQFKEHNKNSPH